jgi:methylthioxylose transferase
VTAAATQPGRGTLRSQRELVPLGGATLAGLTVLVGQWIKASGGRLGVFFPPFYAHWHPDVGRLAVVSFVVLGGSAVVAVYWVRRARRPILFAAGLYVLALGLGVSLNVSRGGIADLWAVFKTGPGGSLGAYQEYLPGLPALGHGVHFYVSHFPALIPRLPIHVKGNPPGPLVALHLLGIDTPQALTILCVGLGALTAPLAYDLGRTLGDETRGRVAGVLNTFAPALLLWGVTSADYAFSALGLAAACLLVRRHPLPRATGALAAAATSFFSWLLLAIPAWAVLVVLRREGPRRALALAALCALAMLAVYGVLALTLGYDPIATLNATGAAYRHGISRHRPYVYWLLGSPAAWWIGVGLPIGWTALRAGAHKDAAALALFAVVIISAILGLTKAETERIWLPFVPLACVAAAAVLSARRLPGILWLLVIQALAIELLFDTVW